ncbi:MAG: hypothetical protein MPK01_08555, partial [Gammaproteobacteria bacterium]|nr:hypothetical protein [Gammaproteobacteria bacterium]
MTQASRPRASARFLAALPLLFIALFASSGAFAQQGLNFRMEPADGVIPIAKKGGEKCAARQRTVVGNTPGSITVVNDPVGNCPVVRVYPRFESPFARPSAPTQVKILPITPSVRVSGVERASDAPATTVTDVSATLKAAVDAAKAAYDEADAALETKSNLSTRATRANTVAELRDLREKRRAYLVALRAYQAAKDEARAATDATKLHDAASRKVQTDGTIREEYRPVGYTPLAGDQYAVYGEDYFLDVGEFKLMPDGTIDPPFFEVRGLKVTEERDLTAMIGLYAVTGDLKYNRAAHLGGSIAEIAVKFQAPQDTEPTVELYLAPVNEDGGIAANDRRGPHLEKLGAGVIQPVRLKARLHKPRTLESLAADEEIRLKLSELPGILTLPLPRTSAPANPTFQHNNALAGATLTYRGVVYAGMQETLTIAAGESTAVTDAFLVLPNELGGKWKIPDPVIVDANGAPRALAGELSAVGREFSVVASSTLEAYTDSSKSTRVFPVADTSLKDGREPRPVEHPVGLNKVSRSMVNVGVKLNSRFNELINMRVRGPASGTTVATEDDFMKRMPDGSFVPLGEGEFPYEYSVVVSQDGTTATGHYVPVFLRDDGLVEGWELFRLRFHDEEQDSTIPSNGFITLRTAYASTNGNIVHGELELTGDIFGGGENYGVAVGSGGSLAYSTTGSSNVLTLTFTDVTGEDGSGGPDGILSGDELATTGTWTHDSSTLVLDRIGALPANLEGHQFIGCKTVDRLGVETKFTQVNCQLPQLPSDAADFRTIGFAAATATIGEGGRAEGDALTLTIDPPLDRPAKVRIAAVGVETDSTNLTANEAGDYPDIRAETLEVQLRAGQRSVKFLPPHVLDDRIVEADETFKLQLQTRMSDPFVIATDTADGHAEATVTIKDNDTSTFTVEESPGGQLRAGTSVTMTGQLDTPLQVTAGGNLVVLAATSVGNITIRDRNSDGYITGAELSGTNSQTVDTLLSFAEYRYAYNRVQNSGTGTPAIRAEAFLFPLRSDPGRAHLRRHAEGFFELPKIAPRHAGPDFSETATGSGNTFAGVIRINEGGSKAARAQESTREAMSATVPVSLSADFGASHLPLGVQDVTVEVTAHYDADGDGPLPPRSVVKPVVFGTDPDATEALNAEFAAADFNALGITDDEVINRNR